MIGGSSGFDGACNSGHDSFIDSGFDSRDCDACGGTVFTGSCCTSRSDRFGGACLDSITANECSLIGGTYKGDGSTCLDFDVECTAPGLFGYCCCDNSPSHSGAASICLTAREADPTCTFGGFCSGFGIHCGGEARNDGICCTGQTTFSCRRNFTALGCSNLGGTLIEGAWECNLWYANPGLCPGCHTDLADFPASGACYEEGTTTCAVKIATDCVGWGDVFDESGSTCSATIYPGACCSGCARCIDDMPEYLCDKIPGSVWKGVSTTCAGEDCSAV